MVHHTFDLNDVPIDIDIPEFETEVLVDDEIQLNNDDCNIINSNTRGDGEGLVEDHYHAEINVEIGEGESVVGDDYQVGIDAEIIDDEGVVGDDSQADIENEDTIGENIQSELNPGYYVTFEHRRPYQMLNNKEKEMVYNLLLQKSVNGKLRKKHTTEVSNILKLPIRTIQRIWKTHKNTPPSVAVDFSHKKTGNCGRKRIQIDMNTVQQVPFSKRTTSRSLGAALGVCHRTILKMLREGRLLRHTNAIKPYLKDENQRARVRFCTSMIDWSNYPQETKFIGMYNYVHIDEKWFYMTKKSEKYYLLPTEDEPLRTCQSKNYIGKVMFLVAMARPRFNADGTEIFSGKIGLFPFINMVPAQRRSRNRDAVTIEMKPVTSVTREIVRACLIEKIIPAIRNVWPSESSNEVIYIQQDNARTHVDPSDTELGMAILSSGLNIQLICQPANSPDMNILDLGFFSALQSLQYKENPTTVEELVQAVIKSFNEYPSQKINHVWLTLQLCMQETLKIGGSNRYKIPHVKKLQLENNGLLPTQISCDPEVLQNAMISLAS